MEQKATPISMFNTDDEGNVVSSEWVGMPEYNNIDIQDPLIVATFKFATQKDFDEFYELLKDKVYKTDKVFDGMQRKNIKSAWYPLKQKASKYVYVEEK